MSRKQSGKPGPEQSRRTSQKQLLSIAHAQEVDVPIMNYRVVGDRIELFLYGGQVVSAPADFPQSASLLEELSIKELKAIASRLSIRGRSKMDKDELIEAILSAPSK